MGEWTKRFGLNGKRALVTGATKGIGLKPARCWPMRAPTLPPWAAMPRA